MKQNRIIITDGSLVEALGNSECAVLFCVLEQLGGLV